MAWKNGSITLSVSDWGPAGSDYAKCYAKATLKAETYGESVQWQIFMETKVNGGTSKQPAVSLYLKIGDTVIFDKYWVYGETNPAYLNWPTKNGSVYPLDENVVDEQIKIKVGGVTFDKSKLEHQKSWDIPIDLRIVTSQDGPTYGWGNGQKKTGTLTKLYYTEVEAGTVSIIDNGDNTFTLTGSKGANGTNNAATGPTLTWGYDTNYSSTFKSGDIKTLDITTPSNAARTVYAKGVTGATYGDSKTATASKAIKQYVAPSAPSNVKISYKKSRFTVKENWTLMWTAGKATNSSSPVEGYRIRIYKNGKTIQFKDSQSEILTNDSGSGDDRYYYDRNSIETEMNINTKTNIFAPGDKVKVLIHAYTVNGKGSKIFSSGVYSSEEYTVQNAGIVRVKVGGAWKEGQVYVKVNGAWKEAETINTKVGGTWKEAQ